MAKLRPGDEVWTFRCDWCGRGVREVDITETLDGSELCLTCIAQYTDDQDADDGPQPGFISNIDDEERFHL